MAWLTALLPAQDAASIWARIDASARCTVRTPGEDRTVAQARADVLTQLVTTDAAARAGGATGAGGPTAGASGEGVGGARVAMVRSVVNVTIPATALLGLDEAPGELGGYGPIPAAVARVLAADGDSTWRRIVTDPVTGVATDVSRTAYRPGTVLGDFVRTRDPVCTFPGCQVPSVRCDLDHIEPFDLSRPSAGQTRASNLRPVCRAHHNAKTHGVWSVGTADGGAVRWRAPSGRTYDVPATPIDTHLASKAPLASGMPPRAPVPPATRSLPEDDGPPPF
jgi:hypothetical protein